MSSDLKDEFRQVRFRCTQSPLPAAFFIVTACNPEGNQVDGETNRVATERLKEEIVLLGFEAFPVTGGSWDFSHAEPGQGIVCSRAEALALARLFRQLAIFEVRDGRVFLIGARDETPEEEEVGRWDDLLYR